MKHMMEKFEKKKIKINDNNKVKIIVATIIIFLTIAILIFILERNINARIAEEVVVEEIEVAQEIEWLIEEDEGIIDINHIIKENVNNHIEEVVETKVVELEYETEYTMNPNLPNGKVQVLQQGQDGKQELIIKKQYEGKELVSDKQIGRRIVTPSINRIVEVGTSSYYDNYKIKVGDTVYATPYELNIRKKAKKDAEIIIKINQDSKLNVKKKKNNWYYVKYESYYGWVESDCVTYIAPNNFIFNNSNVEYTKNELLQTVSKNMKLNKPSGLNLEQFEKIFENESKDKNGIFKDNAKYFYYIEQSYGINGIFVAAVGIHESGWGTSKIAVNKKNLFGYGAYDMNAYASAYAYNGYAAGIDMLARVFMKHYLNPKGTSIYNGEVSTGKYYNGSTVSGVNKKYATDKNWANAVYAWMEYLYNKL